MIFSIIIWLILACAFVWLWDNLDQYMSAYLLLYFIHIFIGFEMGKWYGVGFVALLNLAMFVYYWYQGYLNVKLEAEMLKKRIIFKIRLIDVFLQIIVLTISILVVYEFNF